MLDWLSSGRQEKIRHLVIAHGPDRVPNIFLPAWPSSANKHFIIWPLCFSYFFYYYIFFRVIKSLQECSLTSLRQLDRKLGIYIATKLFQLTSRKEPSNPSKTDRFFRHYSCHRVQPSFGNFLNSFAMKARPGSHGSYDKLIFHTIPGLSCSKGG